VLKNVENMDWVGGWGMGMGVGSGSLRVSFLGGVSFFGGAGVESSFSSEMFFVSRIESVNVWDSLPAKSLNFAYIFFVPNAFERTRVLVVE